MGFRRSLRPARGARGRRRAAAQQPLRPGGKLAAAAGGDAPAHPRAGAAGVGDQRLPGGAGGGHGPAHQHGDAGLLLRRQRGAAAGGGDRAHPRLHPQDLRPQGGGGGGHQPAGPRRHPRAPAAAGLAPAARGGGAAGPRPRGGPAGRGSRLRARGDRSDAGASRRRSAGERPPLRRHLAHRARPAGRSATSPRRCRCGRATSACSAASA